MKVSGKIFGLMFSISVGFIMSFAMSFFLLLVNVGWVNGFFFIWMKSFAVGFAISLPIAIMAIPLIKGGLEKSFTVRD